MLGYLPPELVAQSEAVSAKTGIAPEKLFQAGLLIFDWLADEKANGNQVWVTDADGVPIKRAPLCFVVMDENGVERVASFG